VTQAIFPPIMRLPVATSQLYTRRDHGQDSTPPSSSSLGHHPFNSRETSLVLSASPNA
jgi:hypothetical protein